MKKLGEVCWKDEENEKGKMVRLFCLYVGRKYGGVGRRNLK